MTTKNLAEVIRKKLASDPDLAAAVARERFNASVGEAILNARLQSGLTQSQLAQSVGMHQSVIARLEDADYDSHSLRVLRRIAEALGKRIDIRFVQESRPLETPANPSEITWSNVEWNPVVTVEETQAAT